MADDGHSRLLDQDGPAAPPRSNGELVFADPWESRLFGVTMVLHEAGLFGWDEFRELLIAEIAAWERATADQGSTGQTKWSYYERWQLALEKLLAAKGLCAGDELEARSRAFAARPSGHDH